MNSKILILLLLSLNLTGKLFAGDLSLSLGLNQSWLVYPDYPKLDYYFNSGFSIGINYNQRIVNHLNMTIGLELFNIRQINYESMEEAKVNHVYLSVPFRMEYEMFKNLYPFANIQPGILVNTSASKNPYNPREMETVNDEMNLFNVFVGGGIKYFFHGKKLSTSVLINYGLLRIPKKEADVNWQWVDWRGREMVLNIEYYLSI